MTLYKILQGQAFMTVGERFSHLLYHWSDSGFLILEFSQNFPTDNHSNVVSAYIPCSKRTNSLTNQAHDLGKTIHLDPHIFSVIKRWVWTQRPQISVPIILKFVFFIMKLLAR